jgi:GNAT superfamily N-acetyltransferase
MWWRLQRPEWLRGKGEGNRRAFRRVVADGEVPGLLAYDGGEAVGWVALAPRASYPRLARSRILAPVDDAEVWAVTCFYVARGHRGRGVTRALLAAAERFARERGGRVLEAYPVDARKQTADAFMYTGAASTFVASGWKEVARRSPTRPIVRKRMGR